MPTLSMTDRQRILSRLFDEQSQTGKSAVPAAMRILSRKRYDSVWGPSDDDIVASIAAQHTGGKSVKLSSAYLDANLATTDGRTQERVAVLLDLYEKGQAAPAPSPFGAKWDN